MRQQRIIAGQRASVDARTRAAKDSVSLGFSRRFPALAEVRDLASATSPNKAKDGIILFLDFPIFLGPTRPPVVWTDPRWLTASLRFPCRDKAPALRKSPLAIRRGCRSSSRVPKTHWLPTPCNPTWIARQRPTIRWFYTVRTAPVSRIWPAGWPAGGSITFRPRASYAWQPPSGHRRLSRRWRISNSRHGAMRSAGHHCSFSRTSANWPANERLNRSCFMRSTC